MTLTPAALDNFDKCPRRSAFLRQWEPKVIPQLSLIYSGLESGLCSDDPEQSATDRVMRMAARKEIALTEVNKFTTVRHLEALAGIVSVALQKRLGPLAPVGRVDCGDFEWESNLFRAQDGSLHRIELISHYDDDRLRAVAHSWRVLGELAALRESIQLTLIVIGPMRKGRRHSPWTKGLLHPQNRTLRFAARSKGSKKGGLNSQWLQVWREQRGEFSTENWLSQMKLDNVLDDLIISRNVGYREDDFRISTAHVDMLKMAGEMEIVTPDSPMRRSACDDWGGCPFAPCCWHPKQAGPENFPHLFHQRECLDTLPTTPTGRMSSADTASSLRLVQAAPKGPGPRVR